MTEPLATLDDWRLIEEMVDATPGIDHWCSGPDWVLPAHRAFAPEAEPLIVSLPHGRALLARYDIDGSMTIGGLEPLWGFACPIITPHPTTFADELFDVLADDPGWRRLVLPGFPDDLELLRTIGLPFTRIGRVGAGEGIVRQVTDLAQEGCCEHDPFDAWEARRRPKFRRNLRRAHQRASEAGVRFVDTADGDLFDRILRIERTSWKGREGDGLCSPTMGPFYAEMTERLGERGRVRATIAQHRGRDVAFIIGGVRNGIYRGLQLSYASDVADLSLSHLLQRHTIASLVDEGVTAYDLGMDMEYKRQWADRAVPSLTLVVERS